MRIHPLVNAGIKGLFAMTLVFSALASEEDVLAPGEDGEVLPE